MTLKDDCIKEYRKWKEIKDRDNKILMERNREEIIKRLNKVLNDDYTSQMKIQNLTSWMGGIIEIDDIVFRIDAGNRVYILQTCPECGITRQSSEISDKKDILIELNKEHKCDTVVKIPTINENLEELIRKIVRDEMNS